MNLFSLYERKQYHKIIICRSHCKSERDFLLLSLALYGIGREKPAIALLQARLEVILDIATKVVYLHLLAKFTQNEEYELEIQYWMLSSSWKRFLYSNNLLLPECLCVSLYDQVSNFQRAGASIKTASFAESCLLDYNIAAELQKETNFGPLIFHAVARGGLVEEMRKGICAKGVVKWAENTQKRISSVELPFKGELFEHRDLIREFVYLASYHYLRQDRALTLTYCKQAIDNISYFQVDSSLLELEGVLAYELETVAFMGIEFLDTTIQDSDLKLFEEAIFSRGNPAGAFSSGKSIKYNAFMNQHFNLPLRESFVFSSFGHVIRVQATKTVVTLSIRKEDVSGTVWNRKKMLEAAKCYAIAAAVDASDSPRIVKKYDQAIWCLLLAGGISVDVIKLLIEVRNFHKRNLFYFYGEEHTDTCNQKNLNWPQFCNQFEILEIVSDLFKDSKLLERSIRLSPSIIEFQRQLYISTTYLQFPQAFVLRGGSIVEPKHAASIKFTLSEKLDCVETSNEVAKEWFKRYTVNRKELPLEIMTYYRDRILTNLFGSENPKVPTSTRNETDGQESMENNTSIK